MVVKRSGLGRNLSALLSQTDTTLLLPERADHHHNVKNMSLTALQPGKYQPRGHIDNAELEELSQSIKKQGLLQPIVVRPLSNGQYEILAGERRWRACQLVGLEQVPVLVREVDDKAAMAIALVENLQRQDLNVMDEARAMHRLTTEFSLTHQQIAELLSKSRTAVSNCLRLLNLTKEVRMMLEEGKLDMGHARSLLVLSEAEQQEVARLIVARQLSVRDTEALVARVKQGSIQKETWLPTPTVLEQAKRLARAWETKVKVKTSKGGKGTLVIHYDDEAKLEQLMEQFLTHLN